MNKIFRNGLVLMSAAVLAVSCADYNVTDDFTAEPDPTFVEPYKDLGPVKTYIDRIQYPNMTIGATLKASDFNKQELAHAAAITNFDNVAFGTSLMSGGIINGKGVMNFTDMTDLLDHVEEIGSEVFGSPIAANSGQADEWINMLTSPIEIIVDYVMEKAIDYTKETQFSGTGKASIVKYDGQNALRIGKTAKAYIIEGFDVDPTATYSVTFYAKSDKNATFNVYFSGTKVDGIGPSGKWTFKAGLWSKIVVETKVPEGVTDGYLQIENSPNSEIYISKVEVGYYPDNHRDQTVEEINDTINYALNAWCDGLMKNNAGRIKSFDLIDEAIDPRTELENGMLDLRHSSSAIYWQDIFGSENYAPKVSKAAIAAFEKYGGNASDLRFFVSESGLEDAKKMESLNYWMTIWENNGARIDGINAKVNLTYSENQEVQAANEASLNTLFDSLAKTGKLIRISNFDIKYQDATGASVAADKISDSQRQNLADYYGHVIKSYMNKIPKEMQAGICKGNMVDTSDPVGLWSIKNINTKGAKDWVRNATYKAFCDALSGK